MYPCLFPNRDDRCHYELDHSCLQHTNYQLLNQDGVVSPILYGRSRSLGQQFLVDQFAKSELSRLHYIKCDQKEICAEVYSGAKDAMKKSDGDGDLKNHGKRVILPSSFIGGD